MNSLLKDTARICQVCKKVFPNGKALGGHMRTHPRTQKLSFMPRKTAKSATSLTIAPLPTSEGANNLGETVLMRTVHPRAEAVIDLETDLSKDGIGCKRKNRWDDLNELTLAAEEAAEEAAAEALLILSDGPERPEYVPNASDSSEAARKEYIEVVDSEDEDEETRYYRYLDQDDEKEDEVGSTVTITEDKREEIVIEDEDEDDDEIYLVAKDQNKCKKKYKCDLCGLVLRSYQALGGHRTSHRNKRLKMMMENGESSNSQDGIRRHFPCEICGKVFQSGQALGGHKKVHFMFLKPST